MDEYPEATTFAEVRGIAADLRFLEALMYLVASYGEEISMELWHARLLVCVADLAPQVGTLAGRLERELIACEGNASEERGSTPSTPTHSV